MALIEAINVVKRYKVGSEIITALDGINLSIGAGRICGYSGHVRLWIVHAAEYAVGPGAPHQG